MHLPFTGQEWELDSNRAAEAIARILTGARRQLNGGWSWDAGACPSN